MKPAAPEASARSPFAGCAILITAVLVMMSLVGFSIYALFRQADEIAKFTSEKKVPLEVSAVDGNPAVAELTKRIEVFRKDLLEDRETTLALSPEDINLAIAAYQPLNELRGTCRVQSIESETLRIAISYRMNGKPRLGGEGGIVSSEPRFLNGTMVARPGLSKSEFVLRLDNIEVPGAAVPKEFIELMSPYRVAERYLTDATIGPAMAKLTSVGISDGKLVLKRVAGETAKDVIGRDQVDHASSRLFKVLGAAACVFLLFAGGIVFIGLRKKAARS